MRFSPALIGLLALAACSREVEPPAGKALSCDASEGGGVSASDAFVREQADASAMTAAYFTLCNGSMTDVTLTGLSTPAAGIVELHETTRDANGVVSMAPTGDIILAPGERVVFAPGGKHAMLMSLSAPIAAGSTTSLSLQFADGSTIAVEAGAKSAAEAASQEGR